MMLWKCGVRVIIFIIVVVEYVNYWMTHDVVER